MKILYTAEVSVTGGRDGEAHNADRSFSMKLATPQEMGGAGGEGFNPEQFFAAGYAACFQTGLIRSAQGLKQDASQSVVTAKVGVGPNGEGGFALDVELHIHLPGIDRSVGEELIKLTHQVCPYSNATRGNISVRLFLEEQELN